MMVHTLRKVGFLVCHTHYYCDIRLTGHMLILIIDILLHLLFFSYITRNSWGATYGGTVGHIILGKGTAGT